MGKRNQTKNLENEREERNYSLKLLEDFLAGATVVDELVANLAHDILDYLNIDLAGGGSRHR